MTTTNTNELSPADSAACEDPDNNESLSITAPVIGDPLFMHIGETFITRDLVRLKQVSNEIADLVSSNTVFTNQARWQGNMEDWYFPLLVLQIYNKVFRKFQRTWSGVHHSSGRVHRLPCLSYFFPGEHPLDPNYLLASSRGLVLLVKTFASMSWSPLVVSNPVTKEWRELPEPDCGIVGLTSWKTLYLAFLIVDERANTYKVILILTRSIVVYKSTSKTWSYWNLPQPIPLSIYKLESLVHGGDLVRSSYFRALGVVVNSRLHFAELAYGGNSKPTNEVASGVNMQSLGGVRVHEVDDDAGVWKPVVEYPLRNYMPSDLHREYEDYGFRKSSYLITIVECMGGMYAIIPAAMDVQEIGEEIRLTYDLSSPQVRCVDVGILPFRFYILRLQGGSGRVFGQLLIHDASLDRENAPPPNRSNRAFYESLYFYIFKKAHITGTFRWYHCSARGSVIWVSVGNYVVQYDVVSGRSTTHILGGMLASAGEHSLASALSLSEASALREASAFSEASYRSVFRPHFTFEPSLYANP